MEGLEEFVEGAGLSSSSNTSSSSWAANQQGADLGHLMPQARDWMTPDSLPAAAHDTCHVIHHYWCIHSSTLCCYMVKECRTLAPLLPAPSASHPLHTMF
jgi:hypothetical protein